MNEAKFSTTIKFIHHGFDEQLTIRNDSDLETHLKDVLKAITILQKLDCQPTKAHVKNHQPTTESTEVPPLCKKCGSSDSMELVSFTKDGKQKDAWKCQACERWYYESKKGESK